AAPSVVPRKTIAIDPDPEIAQAEREERDASAAEPLQHIGPRHARTIRALEAQPPRRHAERLPAADPEHAEEQNENGGKNRSIDILERAYAVERNRLASGER